MTIQETWALYAKYVEAWKPIADDQRAEIVAETLAENLDYFGPDFQGGPETAILDMQRFQRQFPGAHFTIDDISAHHDVALFTWVLVQPDGSIVVKGHDEIRVTSEGKIARIITFAPSVSNPL